MFSDMYFKVLGRLYKYLKNVDELFKIEKCEIIRN